MRTLYKTVESYTNLTNMEIKAEKSAYTVINSQTNFNPTANGIAIPNLPLHKTYKYCWKSSRHKQAKNDFEKDFFKLMNNSVYGKTMENVRKNVSICGRKSL
jgi:hypothetical protein